MADVPSRRRHKTDPPPLSAREVRFCQLWVETGNATRSYIDSGFAAATRNAAGVAAFGLLRKPKIRDCIRMLRSAAADAALATVERIAQGLSRVAFCDRSDLFDEKGRLLPPHLWPADVAATVEGVEVEEVFETVSRPGEPKRRELVGYTRKVRTAKRTEALKVLAQWRRMVGQERADDAKKAADPLVVGGEAQPDNL